MAQESKDTVDDIREAVEEDERAALADELRQRGFIDDAEPRLDLRNPIQDYNSQRVGRRCSPIQLGLALAPVFTCCLSMRSTANAHHDNRSLRGTRALANQSRDGSLF